MTKRERLDALLDFRAAFDSLGKGSNPALYRKEILEGMPHKKALVAIEELEIADANLQIEVKASKESQEAKKYLQDTDYIVLKALELGVEVPRDITLSRKNARLKVVE